MSDEREVSLAAFIVAAITIFFAIVCLMVVTANHLFKIEQILCEQHQVESCKP